ncbi:hypothetical protein HOH87_05130 [bacterium]|jgi:uncharacterized protein (TIGR03492 family)|nr:hypothetical protein [bacterium]
MTSILLVSNGYGEDVLAGYLAKECQLKGARVMACPLVGEGDHYAKQGISIAFKNVVLPSGGFWRRLRDVIRDLFQGVIGQMLKQRRKIKRLSANYQITIAVGDVFCLWMAAAGNRGKVVFIPTAKSDRFMAHSWIENWLIRRLSSQVFPRDTETESGMRDQNLPATFLGNLMWCGLSFSDVKPESSVLMIGILPGSREEAYANMAHILNVIVAMGPEAKKWEYCVARAPQFNVSEMSEWLKVGDWDFAAGADGTTIRHSALGIRVQFSDDFQSVIQRSTFLIGLAGTANEQAVYCGRPVVAFPGTGPQTSLKRFEEQAHLLGNKLHVIPETSAQKIGQSILAMLDSLALESTFSPPQGNVAEVMATAILT